MVICPKCNGEITYLTLREVTVWTERFGGIQSGQTSLETTWRCPLCDAVLFAGKAEEVQAEAEKFLG